MYSDRLIDYQIVLRSVYRFSNDFLVADQPDYHERSCRIKFGFGEVSTLVERGRIVERILATRKQRISATGKRHGPAKGLNGES